MSYSLFDVLKVFFCSMLPIIELRGSIILGAAEQLPWWLNYFVSTLGNFIPIPFILLFIRKILEWMKNVKYLDKVALWLEKRALKKSSKVTKYAIFGLFLFVAIPIPGTGAWMGSLIAALLNMKFKNSLLALTTGILVAGVIMVCASYGFIGFLKFLV